MKNKFMNSKININIFKLIKMVLKNIIKFKIIIMIIFYKLNKKMNLLKNLILIKMKNQDKEHLVKYLNVKVKIIINIIQLNK